MARLSISIRSHQQRADGTYPISILVSHMGSEAYVPTGRSATQQQLVRKPGTKGVLEIKEKHLHRDMLDLVLTYEKELADISLHGHTAQTLAKYLASKGELQKKDGRLIDFMGFCRKHIEQIKKSRSGTASGYNTLLLSLQDFTSRDILYTKEFTANFLAEFEAYMKKPREITRQDQFGIQRTRIVPPMSEVTIYRRMKDLRTLYYLIRNAHNDEESGVMHIPNNPFRKHPISQPLTEPKAIDTDSLLKLYVTPSNPGTREELGKDFFFMSFFLLGLNPGDAYFLPRNSYRNGRLEYNRRKTMGKRKDRAAISVKVEKIVVPIFEKYLDPDPSSKELFTFRKRYGTKQNFVRAVNAGLSSLCDNAGIPAITSYVARHTFASFARNECGISKDIISLMLNHTSQDKGERVTDMYLKKDWSLMDKANEKLIHSFSRRLSSFQKASRPCQG